VTFEYTWNERVCRDHRDAAAVKPESEGSRKKAKSPAVSDGEALKSKSNPLGSEIDLIDTFNAERSHSQGWSR
jgi:hypothetical protein